MTQSETIYSSSKVNMQLLAIIKLLKISQKKENLTTLIYVG